MSVTIHTETTQEYTHLIRDLNRSWDAENARHSDEIHSMQAKAQVDIHQKSVNDGRGLSVSDNFYTT